MKSWRVHLDRHILPTLGDLKIQQCSVEDVEHAASCWAKTASAKTANKILTTLTAIFKRAQAHGPLESKANVAGLAERVKVANEDTEEDHVLPEYVYTEIELKRLIESTEPGSFERVLVMTPALLGLRIGEVPGLQWQAIDFKANTVSIRTSLVVSDNENGVELKTPKTKTSRLVLDMPRELAHELKLWKLRCPQSPHDLVFVTPTGNFCHQKNVGAAFDSIIARAGVRRLTFHKLRHTFSSLLLSRGVSITEVSRLLGHRDCAITLRVYSHFVPRRTDTMQELASSILQS